MARETVKKYIEKYSLGVVETENSLELYNSYFRNMGFKEGIEALVRKRLDDKVFVRVLDIGCGNAGFLADLKKEFDEGVHTIGADLLMPEHQPDQVILGDALEAEFPKELDFVFSFRSLHEVGEPEKIVQKVYASLAKGGKAFLSFRTMDLLMGGRGIAEITSKEARALEKMVRARKLGSFSVGGFEVTAKDTEGKKRTAGVNIFLEK